jgi:ankyrin repeat protein
VNAKNKEGYTALIRAAWNGHTTIVELLLAAPGIDVNAKTKNDDTALITAAENGHTAIVELLLAAPGIDVNASDEDGNTALTVAVAEGHTAVVRLIKSFFDRQSFSAVRAAVRGNTFRRQAAARRGIRNDRVFNYIQQFL